MIYLCFNAIYFAINGFRCFSQADLVAQIANLVDEGKIVGVSDIRDESDRSGMRVVIELKRGNLVITDLVNSCFKHLSI